MPTIEESIEVADPTAVALHVAQHCDADSILMRATREIRERFGKTGIHLGVDDGQLILTISTGLSVDEADERYVAFVRQWWTQNVKPDHRFLVTLSFV